MSDEDIAAGSRWLNEISKELVDAGVGILCITPENQASPWLLFEAGALSKTLDQTFVCPLLYGITAGQLTGPLTQFQTLVCDREGILRLLTNLNKALGSHQVAPADIEEIFEVWWPRLEARLVETPALQGATINKRSDAELLEEILTNTREQLRRENERMEHTKLHGARLDEMLPMFERFALTADHLRKRGQALEVLIDNLPVPKEMKKAIISDGAAKAPESLFATMPNMQDMIEILKEESRQSGTLTRNILEPDGGKPKDTPASET